MMNNPYLPSSAYGYGMGGYGNAPDADHLQYLLGGGPSPGVMKKPKRPLGIFKNPTMLPHQGPITPSPMHPPLGIPPIFSHGIR
jgi:hypothetical protein